LAYLHRLDLVRMDIRPRCQHSPLVS
jgi:hypothetical protein